MSRIAGWNRGRRTGLNPKPLVDYAALNRRNLSQLVYCPVINAASVATCDSHASAIDWRDAMLGIRGGRGWVEIFPRFDDGPASRCELKDYLVAR